MYVTTEPELAQLGLEGVLFGSNDTHNNNWQRVFVLVGLEARQRAQAMQGCDFRVRLQALSPQHSLLQRSASSPLGELGCQLSLDAQGAGE